MLICAYNSLLRRAAFNMFCVQQTEVIPSFCSPPRMDRPCAELDVLNKLILGSDTER